MGVRKEKVKVSFELDLEKDLLENEIICPKCGGTGLQVDDKPFGLSGEKGKHKSQFPYKKQTIVGCSHCYNGIQKVCGYCDKNLGRALNCNCEGCRKEVSDRTRTKTVDTWENSKKVTVAEHLTEDYSNMVYVENLERFFSNIGEVIEFLKGEIEGEELDISDVYGVRVYKTWSTGLSFDAHSVIELATDQLHEDAFSNAIVYRKELQETLDAFAKKLENDTMTYFPDYGQGISISVNDVK